MHGTYVGKDKKLMGKTAILRDDPVTNSGGNFGLLLVQFDDTENLPMYLTHAWVLFDRRDFNIDPKVNWE